VGVEERIRTELERLATGGDSGDLFDKVVWKRQRIRLVRKLEFAGLAVVVVAGTLAGTFALSRVFRASQPQTPLGPTTPNGLLALSMANEQRDHYIAVVNPDGSAFRAITTGDVLDMSPAWSPDGVKIAFWRASQEKSSGIWVMNADGTDAHPLLETQASIGSIAWSPDGTKIGWIDVFTPPFSGSDLEDPQDFYVMSSDGTDVTAIVTDGQVTDFAWSPDGSEIVLERQSGLPDNRVGYDLSIVNANGTGETTLTEDHSSMDPAWSPDGTKIAFVGSAPGEWRQRDLFVMNVDGSDRKQLTTGAGAVENPTWSSDGTKIAFVAFPNADSSACELTVVDPDGSNPVTIADKSSLGGCPTGISWQPVAAAVTGTASPEPTATPSAVTTTPPWRDIAADLPGVGRVCGLTSGDGDFVGSGAIGVAYVFEPEPEGGCTGPNENFQYLGIATGSGSPVEIVSPKLRECGVPEGCWVFSTPDITGDGQAEVAVATAESPYLFFQIWNLVTCGPAVDCTQSATLEPLSISAPGDPAEGFPPGPAVFRWGGTPNDTAGVRCDTTPQGKPELIEWFTASSEAHFEIEGVQLILTAETPWDPSNPPSLGDLCGAPVVVPDL
jgi:Tol biopolymer transport system component